MQCIREGSNGYASSILSGEQVILHKNITLSTQALWLDRNVAESVVVDNDTHNPRRNTQS